MALVCDDCLCFCGRLWTFEQHNNLLCLDCPLLVSCMPDACLTAPTNYSKSDRHSDGTHVGLLSSLHSLSSLDIGDFEYVVGELDLCHVSLDSSGHDCRHLAKHDYARYDLLGKSGSA